MVLNLAKEYGVDKMSRSFCAWSHVVSLLFSQLTHSIGLNDVCDTLRNHSSKLLAIRGAKAPALNTLSNANKKRNSDMAYVNFKHLYLLTERGVYWVTRAKDNMKYKVRKRLIRKPEGNIIKDELIYLTVANSKKQYSKSFRRVEAKVEVDGKEVIMVFITNNLDWATSTICELYQARWAIEVFFKQLKQTLQLSSFLGYSKNAIRWQVWTALLLYLLLRVQAFISSWNHSFTRLLTVIRGVLWSRFHLLGLLESYGIAGSKYRMCAAPQDAYLPGFSP